MPKTKILNDPIYGFIDLPPGIIIELIDHPYFQRLRRIKQLGLTDYVYPGAIHTRFHHAVGAMHLMSKTLEMLRKKGVEISNEEFEASLIAILLHDIGHGPFSHALEFSLLENIKHESISYLLMKYFNEYFDHKLSLALKIFRDSYERKFFHQLVSSQLDMDRLDYLARDSFYTGVSEGKVGVERIIKMLNVKDDRVVVEEKGIYSVENFLNARRLMYWQVYLHKTSVATEKMLILLINRAKLLAQSGETVMASQPLSLFLNHSKSLEDFQGNDEVLKSFSLLDDYDIWGSIKMWYHHKDHILSMLSAMLLERKLFRVKLSAEAVQKAEIKQLKTKVADTFQILRKDTRYFVSHGEVSNEAYLSGGNRIDVLRKTGEVVDVAQASDLPNILAMSKIVKKNYLCWPKNVSL
ncbi:MAG: HD domain-containing protein [Bacteroidota bacterium]